MPHRLPVLNALSEVTPEQPARGPVGALPGQKLFGMDAQGQPFGPLLDAGGRRYTYLRMSVTDRCNFGCRYCMPPGGEDEHALRPELLSFEEAARLASVFVQLGVERIRLTGGEPTVRKDVLDLVQLVKERARPQNLVMTTNASRLATLAAPLARAGLQGVNISIDTLDPAHFRALTRGGELQPVLDGIDAALQAGLEVKLNAVALAEVPPERVVELVEFAWARGLTPRFIELMPLGSAPEEMGRGAFISRDALIGQLEEHLRPGVPTGVQGHGPARYLHARHNPALKVGFIAAVSDEFCASCNRVRVSARGEIRACLASREAVSLRDIMRAGGEDTDLASAIHRALNHKLRGHYFNDSAATEHQRVGMSLIGG